MDGPTKASRERRGDADHSGEKWLHEDTDHEDARHDDGEQPDHRGDPLDPPPATSGRVEEHSVIRHWHGAVARSYRTRAQSAVIPRSAGILPAGPPASSRRS